MSVKIQLRMLKTVEHEYYDMLFENWSKFEKFVEAHPTKECLGDDGLPTATMVSYKFINFNEGE